MSTSAIEWTDRTWNPVTGCTKVSQGCKHCYAEGVAARFFATQYRPLLSHDPTRTIDTVSTSHHEDLLANGLARPRRFTDVQTHEDRLLEPLRWRKPARVFVNSMSDLFHEAVPDAFIDQVFGVMALAPRHTFQILTKRPQRMRDYFAPGQFRDVGVAIAAKALHTKVRPFALPDARVFDARRVALNQPWQMDAWPLPNVWLGVSVEDQATADERIPLLLGTLAALRFVSYEPALDRVVFDNGDTSWLSCHEGCTDESENVCGAFENHGECFRGIDWVIVGGESGPGARPFDIEWARSVVRQCRYAKVPVFVKQMGANSHGYLPEARDFVSALVQVGGFITGKGGDPAEWPEDLRVREFPAVTR